MDTSFLSLLSKDDDDHDEYQVEQRRADGRKTDSFLDEGIPPLEQNSASFASFSPTLLSSSSRPATKRQQKKLASIEARAEGVRASSVASTRRMLAYCHEANDAGVMTMQMLATQGINLNLSFLLPKILNPKP